MTHDRLYDAGLLQSTKELRELIIANPDLPLIVFAGDESNSGDYSYMCCTWIRASIGEVLDCDHGINDNYVFTDRDDFENELGNSLYCMVEDYELDARIAQEMEKYEPYWKKCIILYVNN